jgi:hypothetical protein
MMTNITLKTGAEPTPEMPCLSNILQTVKNDHNNIYHMVIGDLNPVLQDCWPNLNSGLMV